MAVLNQQTLVLLVLGESMMYQARLEGMSEDGYFCK